MNRIFNFHPFLRPVRWPAGLILSLLFLSACGDTSSEECVFDPGSPPADVKFVSLEETIAAVETKDQLVDLLSAHPLIRDQMFMRSQYPNDSAFINTLYARVTHPGFDTLLMETHRIFGDLSDLKAQFAEAFGNIRYYYPGYIPPTVKTIISGLESDMVVTDTLIVISLDYFLGKDGKYRPRMYDYLLARFEPEDIVPSCMLLYGIGPAFNHTALQDRTVIADMVAFGKSFYFAKHMLPCVPDSVLIAYTPEEIQGARDNEKLIWSKFITDEILYSTTHVVKQKYLGDRPNTLEIGEKCPGRIAQWVGWRIVDKFMESHPDVSLPELMRTEDVGVIFKESQYKPG